MKRPALALRAVFASALLTSCYESPVPAPGASCNLGECELPATLALGAVVLPPAESSLVVSEFGPEEIALSAGVLELSLGPTSEVELDVRSEGSEGRTVPSDVVLARPSRIPGQAAIVTSATTALGERTTVRILTDASYDVFATPLPPEDEVYLRNVTRGISPTGKLTLPLSEPVDAIEGMLLDDEKADVNVRLQGFRDGTDARTTVARVRPGDSFALRATQVEGAWRVQAKATFPNPQQTPGPNTEAPLEGLEFVLDAAVECESEGQTCVLAEGTLSDMDIPLPALPQPEPRTTLIRAVDAAGVQTVVPNAEIVFASEIAVPGAQRAVLTSRAVSDATGQAEVQLVDGFVYGVTVSPPAGSEFAKRSFDGVFVQSATGPLQFDLKLRPRLTGTVFAARPTEEGVGVAGVRVAASPSPGQEESVSSSGVAFSTTTNERGDFSLRVDPGVYDLELIPPEESPHPRWSSDNVPAQEDVTGLQIVLPEGIQIPVVVRDGEAPVSGATVRMLVVSEEGVRAPRERAAAVTDEAGEAVLVLPNP